MSSDIEIINDECQQIMLEVKGQSIEIDIDDKMRDVFATMLFDMGRADHKEALQKLVSHLQHQLEVHSGEPGLSYDPLEIDQGWEPPYRNKNACFEQKLAKEIGEMSDEAVEVAVKKYFVKNRGDEHMKLSHGQVRPSKGQKVADIRPRIKKSETR